MNTIVRKITTCVLSGLLLTSLTTSAAFADSAEISGNGSGSVNTISVKNKTECSVYQKNKTEVLTEVDSSANTGGNHASGNTGGSVTVGTGNATSTVTVTVDGSSNSATNPCCCQCNQCDHQLEELQLGGNSALISGNGESSVNSITVKKKKETSVKQKNSTFVATGVTSKAKTGKNKTNNNTGGTVDVTTGNSDSTVDVTVHSSSNSLNP